VNTPESKVDHGRGAANGRRRIGRRHVDRDASVRARVSADASSGRSKSRASRMNCRLPARLRRNV